MCDEANDGQGGRLGFDTAYIAFPYWAVNLPDDSHLCGDCASRHNLGIRSNMNVATAMHYE